MGTACEFTLAKISWTRHSGSAKSQATLALMLFRFSAGRRGRACSSLQIRHTWTDEGTSEGKHCSGSSTRAAFAAAALAGAPFAAVGTAVAARCARRRSLLPLGVTLPPNRNSL
jgi:hypothetical protein